MSKIFKWLSVVYLSLYLTFAPIVSYAILPLVAAAVYEGALYYRSAVVLSNAARNLATAFKVCTQTLSICQSTVLSTGVVASVITYQFNSTSKNSNNGTAFTPTLTVHLKDPKKNEQTLRKNAPEGWVVQQGGDGSFTLHPPVKLQSPSTSNVEDWPADLKRWSDAVNYAPNAPDSITFKSVTSSGTIYRTLQLTVSNVSSTQIGRPVDATSGYYYRGIVGQSIEGVNVWVIEKQSATPPDTSVPGYKKNTSNPAEMDLVNEAAVAKPVDGNCHSYLSSDTGAIYGDPKDPDCSVLNASNSPVKLVNGELHIAEADGQRKIKGLPTTNDVNNVQITSYTRSSTDPSQMVEQAATISVNQSDGSESTVQSVNTQTYPFPSTKPLSNVNFGSGGDFADYSSPSTGSSGSGTSVSIDTSSLNKETTQQAMLDSMNIIKDTLNASQDTSAAQQYMNDHLNSEASDLAYIQKLEAYIGNSAYLNSAHEFYQSYKRNFLGFLPVSETRAQSCNDASVNLPSPWASLPGYSGSSEFQFNFGYFLCTLHPYLNYFNWGLVGLLAYREINNFLGSASRIELDSVHERRQILGS